MKKRFQRKNITCAVFISWVVLYNFLFVILQLADYALLIGNIGLVIILAVFMFFARKINYNTMEISENSSKNEFNN
ncbi:MAG: inner membrane CreD family protein [Bacteroidales bacterium]|nr:inner membrane CreD family protein [Bacteroidales bacterium]